MCIVASRCAYSIVRFLNRRAEQIIIKVKTTRGADAGRDAGGRAQPHTPHPSLMYVYVIRKFAIVVSCPKP